MTTTNPSPFVSDWENPMDRERYIFHARENYQAFREMERVAKQAHFEYSKWLLASLLVVHGGSIYAISSIRRDFASGSPAAEFLIEAAALNVAGIVATFCVAGFAWLNFQAIGRRYAELANPAIIYRTDKYAPPTPRYDAIGATYYLAIMAAVFAVALFIGAAADVFAALRLPH